MIKKLEIKTTYGSKMIFNICFHINIKMDYIQIVYLHNNIIKEKNIRLNEVKDIKVIVQENTVC